MRVGDYWRVLVRRLEIGNGIKPDEYEVFNGSVIFWFYDGGKIRELLKEMNKRGIPYQVEWDREEGLVGIVLRRDILG